jgi:hypothetical protein
MKSSRQHRHFIEVARKQNRSCPRQRLRRSGGPGPPQQRRTNRKKKEEIWLKEREENPTKKTAFSNRRFHPVFRSARTKGGLPPDNASRLVDSKTLNLALYLSIPKL